MKKKKTIKTLNDLYTIVFPVSSKREAELYYDEAISKKNQGQYKDAENYFKMAIEYDPDNKE